MPIKEGLMSPAKDLGSRHVCWKCGAKFYDLNKPSPTCPKCGADPREDPALKAPPPKVARQAAPAPKRAQAQEYEPGERPEEAEEEEEAEESDESDAEEPAEDEELY